MRRFFNNYRALMVSLLVALALPGIVSMDRIPTLKDAYKGGFLVGVAMDYGQIYGRPEQDVKLIREQFDAISPENVLKWAPVNPKPGVYRFGPADRYVQFGIRNHMFILGHNLVWHKQVPKWVFENSDGKPVSRDTLLMRMKKHIDKLVGRYKGRINAWDVLNEGVNEDGSLRNDKWMKIIGPDYIAKAFEYAHEADPKAQLYYNDFNLTNPAKRAGVIRLVNKLKKEGVPIDGIGMQGHWHLHSPTIKQIETSIDDYAKLGVKVMITELDISVLPNPPHPDNPPPSIRHSKNPKYNPYVNGLPDSVKQELADRYAALFKLFLKHRDVISRVTFWGLNNKESWKNNWPIIGRTDYPLLFNRENQPTEAFYKVIEVGQKDQ